MDKILLCGATHGSNFGDSLFAFMFKKYIEELDANHEIYFTRSSDYSKKLINIKKAKIRNILKCKKLIYIPGGYFGESHSETFIQSIRRVYLYFLFGIFFIILKRPIAIIGVGAGPLKRKFVRKIAVFIFNRAKLVVVRDDNSRAYMEMYGVKNKILVSSDAAQMFEKHNCLDKEKSVSLKFKSNHSINLFLHTTAALDNSSFRKIIESIKMSKNYEKFNFILANDSIIDSNNMEIAKELLPEDRTMEYSFYDPIEFVNLLSKVDFIITPKLHVGIVGSSLGKSVVSLPIHPEKTQRYFKQINEENRCIPIHKASLEVITSLIDQYYDKKIIIMDSIYEKAQLNFTSVKQFLNSTK